MKRSGGVHRPSPPYAFGVGVASMDWMESEIVTENELEKGNGPYNKRMKHSSVTDQMNTANDLLSILPSQNNLLEEPGPLGLRLTKSPSLLELIQMRLAQGGNSTSLSSSSSSSKEIADSKQRAAKGSNSTAVASSNEKWKASNFPASLLRIGHWEYASKYDGDLVAKCYFAKRKLVWEVLDGGLKSKIEMQWTDIVGLNVKFPENGPATMTVVLACQPLFFREIDPQPRKHTLWKAVQDFTNNQASKHRQHFVQVPIGVLNKHFEKLIQCDMRLNSLCRQPEMVLDSPYFECLPVDLEVPMDSLIQTSDQSTETNFSFLPDGASQACLGRSKNLLHDAPSPTSVMGEEHAREGSSVSSDAESVEEQNKWEQSIVPGMQPSMSMTDLVNHIGSCFSGQEGSSYEEELQMESREILQGIAQHLLSDCQSKVIFSDEKSLMQGLQPSMSMTDLVNEIAQEGSSHKEELGTESREILQGIAQHLLSDCQSQVIRSDEMSLMKRVNSLCSLLNMPVQISPTSAATATADKGVEENVQLYSCVTDSAANELPSCKPSIPRNDSYGELLHNLPRIASLPSFLYDISEDGDENQVR